MYTFVYYVVVTTDTDHITVDQLAVWLGEQTWSDFAQSLASYHAKKGFLTEKQEASARKMHAKCMANAAAKTETAAKVKLDQPGIYIKDGIVYKVQKGQSYTANLYAKQLIEEVTGFHWQYIGAKILFDLTIEDQLTAEKAAAFGKLYGVCIRCSKTLTDERSITVGYGATCAGHMGWPWGEKDFDTEGLAVAFDTTVAEAAAHEHETETETKTEATKVAYQEVGWGF